MSDNTDDQFSEQDSSDGYSSDEQQDSYRKRKASREDIEPTQNKPNPLRCPFSDRPEYMKENQSRHTKRTQRYRSTAQSRLGDMTVGDIRYCFQQLRNAGTELHPDMMLYNGQCAGEFALKYLQETSNATRKRRKKDYKTTEKPCDVNPSGRTTMELPRIQVLDDSFNAKKNTNILKF